LKSPLADCQWLIVESAGSTQDVASQHLAAGDQFGAVLALDQVSGRGRFDRKWISAPGESLAVSFVFRAYAEHPQPHLVGMAVAIAVAGVLNCRLQWPNDLVVEGRKLGGILTELSLDAKGRRVPIVGIGVNLNQKEFPAEISERATSLRIIEEGTYDAREVANRILKRIDLLPEPNDWSDLQLSWDLFDATPGKRYQLPSGEVGIAMGVGPSGQLLCSVDGDPRSVYAADALLGSSLS
jgi:BirA family biotin operon repressor/biotin-[acetyl-CoA-carboxylase] ligase